MNEHIIELVERLEHSTNWGDQQRALLDALQPHGYDTFLVGVIPSFERNVQSEAVIAENMKPEWIMKYQQIGYQHDPTVLHCLRHNTPLLWSELARKNTNKEAIELHSSREEFYLGGVTIPLWNQWSPYRFGMSLTSSDRRGYDKHDEMFRRDRVVITTICRIFFSYADWRQKILQHYKLSDKDVKYFGQIIRGEAR